MKRRKVTSVSGILPGEKHPKIRWDVLEGTIVGDVYYAATDEGLCVVSLGGTRNGFEKRLGRAFPRAGIERNRTFVRRYGDAFRRYFRGKPEKFSFPIDLSLVRSPFRRKVLGALRSVPFGRVVAYGDLAARCGSPRAARAVGSAMAANPLPVVIPCHRVLRRSGKLGYYSGGVWKKRALLAHEGVPVVRERVVRRREPDSPRRCLAREGAGPRP